MIEILPAGNRIEGVRDFTLPSDLRSKVLVNLRLLNLTKRESEVALRILEGKSNTEIARELNLKRRRITHLSHLILQKLNIPNRNRLIINLVRMGALK